MESENIALEFVRSCQSLLDKYGVECKNLIIGELSVDGLIYDDSLVYIGMSNDETTMEVYRKQENQLILLVEGGKAMYMSPDFLYLVDHIRGIYVKD